MTPEPLSGEKPGEVAAQPLSLPATTSPRVNAIIASCTHPKPVEIVNGEPVKFEMCDACFRAGMRSLLSPVK
jgi:hypothetical protein